MNANKNVPAVVAAVLLFSAVLLGFKGESIGQEGLINIEREHNNGNVVWRVGPDNKVIWECQNAFANPDDPFAIYRAYRDPPEWAPGSTKKQENFFHV